MAAAAHNPAFAKKVGVPVSVAQEFNKADKGKKFGSGGMAKSDNKEDMKMDKAQDKALIKKAFRMHDSQEHKGEHTKLDALKKGGKVKKYAAGGSIEKTAAGKSTPSYKKMGALGMKKGGSVKESMAPSKRAIQEAGPANTNRKFGESKVQAREKGNPKVFPDSGPSVGIQAGDMKKGGKVKKMCGGGSMKKYAAGGTIDGIAVRGKTKCKDCRG